MSKLHLKQPLMIAKNPVVSLLRPPKGEGEVLRSSSMRSSKKQQQQQQQRTIHLYSVVGRTKQQQQQQRRQVACLPARCCQLD